MRALPTVVRKAGFELTLIRRLGRVAIYRQHLLGGNPDHDPYEVIIAQVRNTNHKGQPVDQYEGYPAAESWGKKGWTCTDLAKAVEKLNQLAQKASCAGTVSRRNGSDTRTHQKGPSTSWVGQGRRAQGQAKVGVPAKNKANDPGPILKGALETMSTVAPSSRASHILRNS